MQEVGAPTTLRTDEASMRRFREHVASIKAFPALFTADRNGTNCNPCEADFLLHLLMSDDGVLYEKNLDTAQELMQSNFRRNQGGSGFSVASIEAVGSITSGHLASCISHHNGNATMALFSEMFGILGF
jgi:hypothetical protein